jgi:CDP-4-dehydro-6-deoxyglucose reductase
VERITHEQWWAGGIMRSIHRYATDGMILTMLLHMMRHFAYDRYRGFRWFSWATGVGLIWLVYISGLNGFMLVWDKLAQFVVVATAEWFDVLPMFNGTLIRNFIYQENVNSRLFTLLAFIHLGAPLIAGVLAWVHVQRVPRAHINPPRQIAIAFTLMFVVLALVKPVVSQGGEANLLGGADQHRLRLVPDAGAGPGLCRTNGRSTCGSASSACPLLLFLAALAAAQAHGCGQGRSVTGHLPSRPQGVAIRFDETLLDAGLRQDINLPYECRNGGCGLCKCTVLSGDVDPGLYQPSACPPRNGRPARCCCAAPPRWATSRSNTKPPVRQVRCANTVPAWSSMEKLTHDVMRVMLKLPEGQTIPSRPASTSTSSSTTASAAPSPSPIRRTSRT